MKNFLSNLLGQRRSPKEPTLQSTYVVFHADQPIASLENPTIEDQFWVSFTLTPLTTSPELLALLYNDDSWANRSLVIREKQSNNAVFFLLASDWEETEDDIIVHSVLKARPDRITLRGPYIPEAS